MVSVTFHIKLKLEKYIGHIFCLWDFNSSLCSHRKAYNIVSYLQFITYSQDGIPVSPCFCGLKALYSLSNCDSHCELLTHESQTKAELQVDNFS